MPKTTDLAKLARAAKRCTACPLYRNATQGVFGEGLPEARIVLIGEQPGDQEDLAGRPFVGPAGKLLDQALQETGIDRRSVYVTNVVKHFKWEPRGKRRLHKKPNAREIAACRPWLEAELASIGPQAILCLGATAAQAVIGSSIRVLRDRGKPLVSPFCPRTFITVHPSSLLRVPDPETRRREYVHFVADLHAAMQ